MCQSKCTLHLETGEGLDKEEYKLHFCNYLISAGLIFRENFFVS